MSKDNRVLFSSEARKKLYAGLSVAAEAISCTLGPHGKTVLIQNGDGAPIITKDGVTVSKSIRLDDPVEMMGAQLLKEAASQTNDTAGDGTTTSSVLTHALVKGGLGLLDSGYNPKKISEGIDIAVRSITDIIISESHSIANSEEIAQIGTISANGDRSIGELIASAMEKVGRDGIITVEDAKGMATTLEIAEGMQFERGYLSPYFVNNNEKMNAVYHDALVLVTDKKLSSMSELIGVLEGVVGSRKPLLVIADEVEGEALQGLVLNRVKSQLPVVAIKAPGFGSARDEYLKDICVLTGAKLVSSSTGLQLDKVKIADLGKAKKFVVDAKSTTIVSPQETKLSVEEHVQDLRARTSDITNSYGELTSLKARIARLAAGVAIIKVGGATELEMVERKYRIEDALHATRAAAEEGIVPGGGAALFVAGRKARAELAKKHQDRDILAGIEVVLKACAEPLRRIAANSGKSPDVVEDEMARHLDRGLGYDASKGEFTDLVAAGVIDPVKVTRTALKNSSSVAKLFLVLDAVVINGDKN